jgi:hypothetical protein
MSEIKALIQKLVKNSIPLVAQVGLVTYIDFDQHTCDVELTDGTELPDVRLRAVLNDKSDGLIVYPKLGSYVLVSSINNRLEQSFVVLASEVDTIVFNEGKNGGLVKIEELVERLNRLEERMTSHQHLYISAAGTLTPTTADALTNQALIATKVKDLENENFKH